MTETYVSLGSRVNWQWYVPMGLAVMAFSLGLFWMNRKAGKPTTPSVWAMTAWGAWIVIGGLLGAPNVMVMSFMPLTYAKATLMPGWPKKQMPLWGRSIYFLLFVGLSWFMVSSEVGRDTVALNDSNCTYRNYSHRDHSIPRDGIQVTEFKSMHLGKPAETRLSWMVMGPNHMIGPDIFQEQLYYGPHGIVSGERVAKRIVSWANVKLKYDSYTLDEKGQFVSKL